MRILGMALFGCALTACSPQATQPADAAGDQAATEQAASTPAATPAVTGAGPVDGLYRCKLIGDIAFGTIEFKGGAYTFQTTDTAWRPNPNSSDGSGSVRYDTNYILPETGPLKDEFEVTGAFSDGSFINFNNNSGHLFTCRPA